MSIHHLSVYEINTLNVSNEPAQITIQEKNQIIYRGTLLDRPHTAWLGDACFTRAHAPLVANTRKQSIIFASRASSHGRFENKVHSA